MSEEKRKRANLYEQTRRSDSIQEIVSRESSFIERWSLYLFILILMALFAGTWFISYPDIIEARGKLTASNGPKPIIAQQTGRLIKLFVSNEQLVRRGETIGWIESTADANEILLLSSKLDTCVQLLAIGKNGRVLAVFQRIFQRLGIVQPSYQIFIAALQQFNDYNQNGFFAFKKAALTKDISSFKTIGGILENQKNISEEDTTLSHNSFMANEQLYKDRVISLEEYRNQKAKLLSKRSSMPQINSNLIANQNQQRDKIKDLAQLEHDEEQQKIIFEQALQTLKSNLDNWIHQYIIFAPVDGTVYFSLPPHEDQYVETGKLLGYVNPPENNNYVEVNLPQTNMGKIDTGMLVHLRFDAYPYQELGYVSGKIDYISRIASDSGFMAFVRLEHGLVTNLKTQVASKSGLKATAVIITSNISILNRLYYSITKATSIGR